MQLHIYKAMQVRASPCKSVQIRASPCKSVQIRASPCKSVQSGASPRKSVQIRANPRRPVQVRACKCKQVRSCTSLQIASPRKSAQRTHQLRSIHASLSMQARPCTQCKSAWLQVCASMCNLKSDQARLCKSEHARARLTALKTRRITAAPCEPLQI